VHRDEGVKDKAQFKKNMLSVSKVALDALMYENLLDCRSSAERNSADLRPEHGKESTQVAQSKPQFITAIVAFAFVLYGQKDLVGVRRLALTAAQGCRARKSPFFG